MIGSDLPALQAKITNVIRENTSAFLQSDHASAAATLYVNDAEPFDEDGGQVYIEGVIYTYNTKDDDNGILFLTSGLTAAQPIDTEVFVYPFSDELQAWIDLEDGTDNKIAVVHHTLKDRLEPGIRDETEQETADVIELDTGELQVRNLVGQIPRVTGEFLDPDTIPETHDDGLPPPQPSTPTLSTRLGTLVISWDGLDSAGLPMPADFLRVDAFVNTGIVGSFVAAGSFPVGGLPYNVSQTVGLMAVDKTLKLSPMSATAAITIKPLVDTDLIGQVLAGANIKDGSITASDKLIANTITGALIQALAITADKLSANAVTADKISGGAIDGKTITGAVVQTGSTGQRFVLDQSNTLKGFSGNVNENQPALVDLNDIADPASPTGQLLRAVLLGPSVNVSPTTRSSVYAQSGYNNAAPNDPTAVKASAALKVVNPIAESSLEVLMVSGGALGNINIKNAEIYFDRGHTLRYIEYGNVSGTTTSTGLLTLSHNLGAAPSVVQVTMGNTGGSTTNMKYVSNLTSTDLILHFVDNNNVALTAARTVQFHYTLIRGSGASGAIN